MYIPPLPLLLGSEMRKMASHSTTLRVLNFIVGPLLVGFLCARHCAKPFLYITLFKLQTTHEGSLLLYPFHTLGNRLESKMGIHVPTHYPFHLLSFFGNCLSTIMYSLVKHQPNSRLKGGNVNQNKPIALPVPST